MAVDYTTNDVYVVLRKSISVISGETALTTQIISTEPRKITSMTIDVENRYHEQM